MEDTVRMHPRLRQNIPGSNLPHRRECSVQVGIHHFVKSLVCGIRDHTGQADARAADQHVYESCLLLNLPDRVPDLVALPDVRPDRGGSRLPGQAFGCIR